MSSAPGIHFEVADRIHSAAIHLLRRLRTADTSTGLSAPRLSALSVVVFGGPLTMSTLADAEQVRLPTISRLVSELEREGLVRRVKSKDDARKQLVSATARGKKVLQAGRKRRISQLAKDLKALDPSDLTTLTRAAELLETLSGMRR